MHMSSTKCLSEEINLCPLFSNSYFSTQGSGFHCWCRPTDQLSLTMAPNHCQTQHSAPMLKVADVRIFRQKLRITSVQSFKGDMNGSKSPLLLRPSWTRHCTLLSRKFHSRSQQRGRSVFLAVPDFLRLLCRPRGEAFATSTGKTTSQYGQWGLRRRGRGCSWGWCCSKRHRNTGWPAETVGIVLALNWLDCIEDCFPVHNVRIDLMLKHSSVKHSTMQYTEISESNISF